MENCKKWRKTDEIDRITLKIWSDKVMLKEKLFFH